MFSFITPVKIILHVMILQQNYYAPAKSHYFAIVFYD